jgi:hypothetical protein
MRLPDGRPLSPVRGIHQADASIALVLPRAVWSIESKTPTNRNAARSSPTFAL